ECYHQGAYARHNAEYGNYRDHGDHRLASLGLQVAQSYEKLKAHEFSLSVNCAFFGRRIQSGPRRAAARRNRSGDCRQRLGDQGQGVAALPLTTIRLSQAATPTHWAPRRGNPSV